MTVSSVLPRTLVARPRSLATRLAFALITACVALLAGCGSGDAPPPAELAPTTPVLPTPPVITQQPANVTTMPGQSASFSVTATGTAPLTYQWQRNGVAITGATSSTYTLASTALSDSGSTFRVVVGNVAGSVSSDDATLTVSTASPVLTISPQPASLTVIAGATASFTVGGTCSSGTLTIQWQRLTGGAFVDIAGATSATYAFMVATGDNGAQFRAVLSCSGASTAASQVATLTVAAPSAVTLSQLPVAGLRDQAPVAGAQGIDPAPGGGWDFVAGNVIRHLSADLSTVTLVAGDPGGGHADGAAASATFSSPFGLTHDASGNIYVADTGNNTIRRIATDGTVTTLAGTAGTTGLVDGTGAAAQFSAPTGITIGPDDNLYVADRDNHVIRQVTTAGAVLIYAGTTQGNMDGAATVAKFQGPWSLVAAPNGDLFVADRNNSNIRRIARSGSSAGLVTTLAGSGSGTIPGVDGVGTAAGIPLPIGLALRGTTLYVEDAVTIRTVDTVTAAVGTFAGTRNQFGGYEDGPLGTAQFDFLSNGVALQPTAGLIVTDNNGVRTVDATGYVATIASARDSLMPLGIGVLAQLPFVDDAGGQYTRGTAIVTDPSGQVVVSETGTKLVRRVATSGAVSLVAGLAFSQSGAVDGIVRTAQFADNGQALAVAPNGTLYTSDNYGVRRIATDGTVTLIAGSAANFGAADGPTGSSLYNIPFGLAVGPTGDVFVSDAGNHAIRRIDATGNTTTYAGTLGTAGSVDGSRTSALFELPGRMAFAPDGSLYVVDNNGSFSSLRKIATDGTVSTVPSGGNEPIDVAVDPNGTIYVVIQESFSQSFGTVDPVTGTYTRLISTGTSVVLGNVNPSLGQRIGSITMHGTKQVAVVSGSELLLITLP